MHRLQGNPVCRRENELDIVTYCAPEDDSADAPANSTYLNNSSCPNLHCPGRYEHVPDAPDPCYCAAPLGVGIRLRSPSISDFPPYAGRFTYYITSNLDLELYQLVVDSFIWQKGPRLRMFLKFYPLVGNYSGEFNASEVQRLMNDIARFTLNTSDIFGPYDLLNFTLGQYQSGKFQARVKIARGRAMWHVRSLPSNSIFMVTLEIWEILKWEFWILQKVYTRNDKYLIVRYISLKFTVDYELW